MRGSAEASSTVVRGIAEDAAKALREDSMPRSLSLCLVLTDWGFLLYWTLAGLSQLGLIAIPAEWMYANYDRPDVIAWNWSFFPLDIAFTVFGLRAVARARAGRSWRPHALVSLTLTMAAGGMAVSYWALLREFDPMWFGMNALLVVWPLFFLGGLLADAPDRADPRPT